MKHFTPKKEGRSWVISPKGEGWVFERTYPTRWKANLALSIWLQDGRPSDYFEAAREEKRRRAQRARQKKKQTKKGQGEELDKAKETETTLPADRPSGGQASARITNRRLAELLTTLMKQLVNLGVYALVLFAALAIIQADLHWFVETLLGGAVIWVLFLNVGATMTLFRGQKNRWMILALGEEGRPVPTDEPTFSSQERDRAAERLKERWPDALRVELTSTWAWPVLSAETRRMLHLLNQSFELHLVGDEKTNITWAAVVPVQFQKAAAQAMQELSATSADSPFADASKLFD